MPVPLPKTDLSDRHEPTPLSPVRKQAVRCCLCCRVPHPARPESRARKKTTNTRRRPPRTSVNPLPSTLKKNSGWNVRVNNGREKANDGGEQNSRTGWRARFCPYHGNSTTYFHEQQAPTSNKIRQPFVLVRRCGNMTLTRTPPLRKHEGAEFGSIISAHAAAPLARRRCSRNTRSHKNRLHVLTLPGHQSIEN